MRLDATDLRYVSPDEFRVLTAVEIGSKNHEVVPTALIAEISGIRGGNVNKAVAVLAKRSLVARVQNARYDGYRLTYGGLDYLALRTFSRRKPPSVASVGKKVGVGKESDIYIVKGEDGDGRILKLHRLGRISFRAIKSKRDYLGKRNSASWMFMSRLSAEKEFAFMKILYQHNFPVPVPIDQARHCVVMSLIDGYPLRQVQEVEEPSELYSELMSLIVRFAHAGLIHGDFNEFNIMIKRKTSEPIVIDFPQMISTRHENAEYYFNRDVNCIRRFFRKRFRYEGLSWPTWKDVIEGESELGETGAQIATANATEALTGEQVAVDTAAGSADGAEQPAAESSSAGHQRLRLDLEVEASGFSRDLQMQLESYMDEIQDLPASDEEEYDEGEGHEDDEDDKEEGTASEEDEAAAKPSAASRPAAEPMDEEAKRKQIADRLEALRLNKALGNDDPSDIAEGTYGAGQAEEDEEDSDSDSESSSGLSDGPPQSDFTAYTREPKARPERITKKQIAQSAMKHDLRHVIAHKIGKERDLQARLGGGTGGAGGLGTKSSGGSGIKAGKAKGHKWKANPAYLVGKGGGGDGW